MKSPSLACLLLGVFLSGCTARTGPGAPATAPAVLAPAQPDRVVELKNGTTLVGTITREEGGKLYVQADLLGPLIIDAAARGQPVARPDPARVIVLKNKSRLVGTVQKEEGGKLFLEVEHIGVVVCDASAVAKRRP